MLKIILLVLLVGFVSVGCIQQNNVPMCNDAFVDDQFASSRCFVNNLTDCIDCCSNIKIYCEDFLASEATDHNISNKACLDYCTKYKVN